MLQNHLLHGIGAAYFAVSSTGSSIDFFLILVKMLDDNHIFEGLFKATEKCWCFLDCPDLLSMQWNAR